MGPLTGQNGWTASAGWLIGAFNGTLRVHDKSALTSFETASVSVDGSTAVSACETDYVIETNAVAGTITLLMQTAAFADIAVNQLIYDGAGMMTVGGGAPFAWTDDVDHSIRHVAHPTFQELFVDGVLKGTFTLSSTPITSIAKVKLIAVHAVAAGPAWFLTAAQFGTY